MKERMNKSTAVLKSTTANGSQGPPVEVLKALERGAVGSNNGVQKMPSSFQVEFTRTELDLLVSSCWATEYNHKRSAARAAREGNEAQAAQRRETARCAHDLAARLAHLVYSE